MARAFGVSLALAAFLVAAPASAATLLTVENGAEAAIALPGTYDLPASSGASPGDLVLNTNSSPGGEGLKLDGPASLFFTFKGKEAGFTNLFNFMIGDVTVFNNQTAIVDATTGPYAVSAAALVVSGGFVPFKFVSNATGTAIDLVNGNITDAFGSIAFKLISSVNDNVMTYLALLNDSFQGDADYDDMVIEITAIRSGNSTGEIPIPAGLVLLLSGLAGLGFLGRARAKSS